jgi:hypothetical protein
VICLDELDYRAWAGAVVDDLPEEHAQDGAVPAASFSWPRRTVETFARLLELAR